MDKATCRLALANLKALKERDRNYGRACEGWAKEGFRPHYCVHGVNQWVDYDCVCWQCEDSLDNYTQAIIDAKNTMHQRRSRLDTVSKVLKLMDDGGMDAGDMSVLVSNLLKWAQDARLDW